MLIFSMQVSTGTATITDLKTTTVELSPDRVARAVNCWSSVRFDVGEVSSLAEHAPPAGIYYKTFKWLGWRLTILFVVVHKSIAAARSAIQ